MKNFENRTERPPRFLSPIWGVRTKNEMETKVFEEIFADDRTEGSPVVAVDIRGEEKSENTALISFSKHDRVEVNR